MSRSKKKHGYAGHSFAESEKEDKKLWHKAFRRKTKAMIVLNEECLNDTTYPDVKEVSDTWDMAKDGKFWFNKLDKKYKKELRK